MGLKQCEKDREAIELFFLLKDNELTRLFVRIPSHSKNPKIAEILIIPFSSTSFSFRTPLYLLFTTHRPSCYLND